MIYVMSDLHGCYEKYITMLKTIKMTEDDELLILGDIVDRGQCGIAILQDLMERKNVTVLRGNHDQDAMVYLKAMGVSNDGYGTDELFPQFQLWLLDGGVYTYEKFIKLPEDERKQLLLFMSKFGVYEEVSVNGKEYFLSHTVPSKGKMMDFKSCTMNDFLIGEPEYEKVYFDNRIIVTGHTPTGLIDENSKGRIWKGNNHIAVDCGAVFGNPLGCLCLDTMEEYYV